MATVTKQNEETPKALVIQNFVVARPPNRTNFDIADWRSALDSAELKDYPNRVNLYDIYSDVKLDPHLSRQWEKRVENITNTQWLFSIKGKEDEEMTLFIDTPEFEELLSEIMEHIAWGITVLELSREQKKMFDELKNVLKVYSVERKHIKPDRGIITKEQYDADTVNAIHYREGKYVNYVAEIGKPKDLGILLNAVPYVILKKGGVSDWAMFVQLFGQPFREYRYNGFDEAVRIQLEKSAQEMGSAPYIVLPDGTTLTLHDIKTNPSGEVHSKLIDYCDKMISILILGNVLTTDNTKVGSNALGNVHSQTQDEVFAADKRKVRRILNNVIRPILYNLGFSVKDGFFHPKEEKNLDKVLQRLKVIQMVKALGAPVDDDIIYQDSDIQKPENYDELKADMEAQAEADSQDDEPAGNTGNKNKTKGKPNKKKKDNLSYQFRLWLADFFDPAP